MNKFTLFLIFAFINAVLWSQITPNGNSGSSMTNYTNGASNDPIYIWCADGLSNNTASLTANAPSGTAPFTFQWYYHDQNTSSWDTYQTQTGASSTITNLPSDGYRVQIYDANNVLVGCYIAWVWNMNSDVTVNQNPTACNASNLSGTVNVNGSFTYYNPPPPESIINASTQITVCFTANHTYVSDLGFFLVGPASCGSPTIPLMPHPQAINASNGCCCNSGDNVNNLCFTTNLVGNINPCTAGAPLTGTYSGYSSSFGNNVTINWAPLYGCNAAEGGWRVQIYDCIGADVGALTNATITFANLTSVCGSPTSITYTSGSISSAINDNSCSAATASIFQVPVSPNLTTPITINANVSYLWTADQAVTIPNPSSSLTPSVSNIPNGITNFTLTATISFGTTVCTNDASVAFTNTCCTAVAVAGQDASYCSGGTAVLGSPAEPGMTYQWSPSAGLSDPNIAQPTVTITNSGATTISTTYTLTVTNVVDGGCTDTDEVVVNVFPNPVVSAGTYSPVCADASSVELIGSPVGGTFSGTGVAGNNFDPATGTQVITYDYLDANGCSGTSNTTITVNPLPVINAGADQTVCEGTAVTLSGSGGVAYQWSGGIVNAIPFTPGLGSQNYTVTGTDINGCVGSDVVSVTVVIPPTASVSANVQTGYPVLDVDLTNNSANSSSYFWVFGNNQSLQTSATDGQSMSYSGIGTYVVQLTASNGVCTDLDTLHIVVIPFPDPIIHVPNVFTPNGDGVNEVWTIDTEWASEMNILILNRWCNQVAEINGLTESWDGKVKGDPANDGVYFYSYRVVGMNGKELIGHGNFTLVR